jgi:dihydroneopterin aldolase
MAPEMERRIFIRDLRLQVSIGIHDFEKDGPQTVVVNVDLQLDSAEAAHGDTVAHSDQIANVLNYDIVHDGIVALAKSRHFNLQETLVGAIMDLCLEQPGVIEARVSTEKPDVYKDCRVGYEAVRRRTAS